MKLLIIQQQDVNWTSKYSADLLKRGKSEWPDEYLKMWSVGCEMSMHALVSRLAPHSLRSLDPYALFFRSLTKIVW